MGKCNCSDCNGWDDIDEYKEALRDASNIQWSCKQCNRFVFVNKTWWYYNYSRDAGGRII